MRRRDAWSDFGALLYRDCTGTDHVRILAT